MKFSELSVGRVFDFDHSELEEKGISCNGLAQGPWEKTSERKYKRVSDGLECKVGTATVAVKPHPKQFTWSDVSNAQTAFPRIYCDRSELIDSPTPWQKRGLQETASGYGRRLNSGLKIRFEGREYRLYVTIFSNAGSTWFKVRGRTIYVD